MVVATAPSAGNKIRLMIEQFVTLETNYMAQKSCLKFIIFLELFEIAKVGVKKNVIFVSISLAYDLDSLMC